MIKALIVFLAFAASYLDYRFYRIPNWLTFGAAFFALLVNLCNNGMAGLMNSLQGLALGFTAMFIFYLFGVMGGGDVKLVAAFGALGGLSFIMNTLLVGSLLGGAFALVYLVYQKGLGSAVKGIYWDMVGFVVFKVGPVTSGIVVPYGVFISVGAVISLFCEVISIAV